MEELMITLVVAFENTVITSAILVEFFGCNPLQVFNSTCKSHLVGFEFGNIDQECVRCSHGGHKCNFVENSAAFNFSEYEVVFLQVPEIE